MPTEDDAAPAEPGPGYAYGPVLDASALSRLASAVDDAIFASTFATRYHRMLPTRVTRILDALAEADAEQAMDAVLSLKVSSTTVGTTELAGLAARIEAQVREADLVGALATARRLPAAAERADAALTAYLRAG